jgi:hypothetical protein
MLKSDVRQTLACTASCAALALLTPLATLAAEPSEYLWDGPLARGATVEIVNPTGDVFVQRSESGRVEVHALRTAGTGDPSSVEIRAVRTETGLALCSEAPGATFVCVAGAKAPAALANYRVDELVAVPAGTTVIVRGQNGKIVIEDGENPSSANGEVRASIAGAARKSLVFVVRDGSIVPA